MAEKKNKKMYWLLKVLSIIVSCTLPMIAIAEHFPLWTESHGTVKSVGAGSIICLIVLVIIFRKTVFNYAKDKLKLNHAPPVFVWLALLIVSYILTYIANFIQDLTTVLWMGLIGCAAGSGLTYIAEHKFGDKKKENEKEDG